ncbi:MAG: hypothetical protein AAGF60_08070 [Pseudomonadota bacterium]
MATFWNKWAVLALIALPAGPLTAQEEPCKDLGFATMCDVDLVWLDYTDDAGAIIPGNFQYDANTDATVVTYPNQSPGVLTAEILLTNYIGQQAGAFGLTTDDMIGHGGQAAKLPGADSLTGSYSFVVGEETVTYITSVEVADASAVVAVTIHYGLASVPPTITPERLAVHEALLKTVARK